MGAIVVPTPRRAAWRAGLFIVAAAVLAGCAATYEQQVLRASTAKLQSGKTIAIATPANGAYEKRQYPASGRMTADAVKAAFERYASSATVVADCRDVACLRSPTVKAADYLVVPEILHWEDRNTEWSGIPDKVEVKLTVYDGRTGEELSSIVISGTSKFMTLGGDRPEHLLPEPIGRYAQSLF